MYKGVESTLPISPTKMVTLDDIFFITALPPHEDGFKHKSKQPKLQVDFEIFYKISKCIPNFTSLSIEIFNQ